MPAHTSGEVRAQRTRALDAAAAAVAPALAALPHLDTSAQKALGALLVIQRVATILELSGLGVEEKSLVTYHDTLRKALPREVGPFLGPAWLSACVDQSVAYASAMARCEKEGHSESECEKRSAPEAAAEAFCIMKHVDDLVGALGRLLGGRFPPLPVPDFEHDRVGVPPASWKGPD